VAGSRRRGRALREDALQTARDIPAIGRAVVTAAGLARRGSVARKARSSFVGSDARVDAPKATVFIDADEWDARAQALGGTSNALLAAVAARLAQRAGRVSADRHVIVALPVNERTDGDTRANAITAVDITVDPAAAATDLRAIRSAIKQALLRRREIPDERWALLPLVPLLPRWLIRGMAGLALGGAATSGASNLGALNPAANRPDGTDADYFAMRTFYPGITTATLHRTGGLLGLLSGRVHGRVFISVLGYQPGRPNTIDNLWRDLSDSLTDFSLTATTWQARTMRKTGGIGAFAAIADKRDARPAAP
jgi:hypothetical protein